MDTQLSRDLRDQLKQSVDDLQTLRDQLRVKLHLAGMDVKDAWAKLEPRVDEFESRVQRAAGRANAELRDMAADLKARLKELNERV